jgi:hypothetical protein
MCSIIEFLEARIAEDEQIARAATAGPWKWDETIDQAMDEAFLYAPDDVPVILGLGMHAPGFLECSDEDRSHIAAHDPSRVLAECAAKRAIVGKVSGWDHEYNDGDPWYSCGLAAGTFDDEPGSGCANESKHGRCTCDLANRQRKLLAPLAAVYKDHLDYQQEWAR